MPTTSHVANLLVITSHDGEAALLITELRESGLAIDSGVAGSPEMLRERLRQRAWDLVLCCAYDPALDLDGVLALYPELAAGIPLLLIGERDRRASDLTRGQRVGARDLIDREDHLRLRWVIGRELADLRQRRDCGALRERLRQQEQRHREYTAITQDAIAFIDSGMHLDANPAYLRLFGYTSLEELSAVTVLDLIAPSGRARLRTLLNDAEAGADTPSEPVEIECRRGDGQTFPARCFVARSEHNAEPCQRLIVQSSGATAPSASPPAAPADPQGDYPGLTLLTGWIASRIDADGTARQPFAVLYIQVLKGPLLLRERGLRPGLEQIAAFGQLLQELSGAAPHLARLADSGFGLVVDGLDQAGAETLATHFRDDARLPRRLPIKPEDEPDCEVGIACVSGRAAAAEDILNAAYRQCLDRVSYELNRVSGMRKPTSLAARGKDEEDPNDAEMAREIKYALDNDKFTLVYQPIISLLGDTQEHYSVLLRLFEDQESLLEAKNFIEPAIRCGLIEQIDRWAIRAAIRVIAEHQRAGHRLNFFINLAEDSFRNPSLIVWICDCLREFGVGGQSLTFQFQEGLAIGNLSSLVKLSESLRKIQCRIAINRFGSAEQPDLLLQALPVDFVLLTPDYTKNLADDKFKQQRLLALTKLTRDFNLKSVVTGVEDARALTVLWTANVDYVQGNFLQRPSPALELPPT